MEKLFIIATFSDGSVWRIPASNVFEALLAKLADEYSCTRAEAVRRFEHCNERDQQINLLQYANMMEWEEVAEGRVNLKPGVEASAVNLEWPGCKKLLMDANEVARMLASWSENVIGIGDNQA